MNNISDDIISFLITVLIVGKVISLIVEYLLHEQCSTILSSMLVSILFGYAKVMDSSNT